MGRRPLARRRAQARTPPDSSTWRTARQTLRPHGGRPPYGRSGRGSGTGDPDPKRRPNASSAVWTIQAGVGDGVGDGRPRPITSLGAQRVVSKGWQPEAELGTAGPADTADTANVAAVGRPEAPAHRLDELAAHEQADPRA